MPSTQRNRRTQGRAGLELPGRAWPSSPAPPVCVALAGLPVTAGVHSGYDVVGAVSTAFVPIFYFSPLFFVLIFPFTVFLPFMILIGHVI